MAAISEALNDALRHHQAGRLSEAEQIYEEILNEDPEQSDAEHLLGVMSLQRGQPERAVERISRAVELRPRTAEFHNSLAAAYRAAGRIDDAVEACRGALALNPHYADAHNNLGNALRARGEIHEAVASYGRALEIAPHLVTARINLADARSEPKTVLHVGCGPANPESLHKRFRGNQWREIRLDINPDVRPDIVGSITDMRAVKSASVDAVWSSHNLEHLFAHEVPIALREFHRVLKPRGLAFITLPDLQQIAKFIAADKLDEVAYESAAGPITTLDCIFGLGRSIAAGNEFMAHRTGFTMSSLKRRLEEAGFDNVRVWASPFNLWAEATASDT